MDSSFCSWGMCWGTTSRSAYLGRMVRMFGRTMTLSPYVQGLETSPSAVGKLFTTVGDRLALGRRGRAGRGWAFRLDLMRTGGRSATLGHWFSHLRRCMGRYAFYPGLDGHLLLSSQRPCSSSSPSHFLGSCNLLSLGHPHG
jgi:hypothetical protein